jgi:phosphonate transport system substrate-binding protein
MRRDSPGRPVRLLAWLAWTWFALAPLHAGAADPAGALTFGVVPQESPRVSLEKWQPLIEWLATQAGVTIRFTTRPSIPLFEGCLAEQFYDIAYMNPLHFAAFGGMSRYRALVRSSEMLEGIVVVAQDSPAQSLDDLAGNTIAFPAPAAFAASVVPQAILRERKISFAAQYLRTHENVYLAVSRGLVAAGGGVEQTFKAAPERVRRDLRVVYRTPRYPAHAWAVADRLPAPIREKVRAALLASAQDAPQQLARIGITELIAARDEDWDAVRALRIDPETMPNRSGDGLCR